MVTALLCVVGVTVAAGCVPDPPPGERWLEVVNAYRAVAHLPPVVEDPALSDGARKHAEYIARTGVIGHSEDPSSPYYTVEGHLAALESNVTATKELFTTDRAFVEKWLTAPFHAVGVLDPYLTTVGYGVYRDPSTPLAGAAALNVIAGLNGPPAGRVVTFPGDGSTVRLTTLSGEHPNPLTSCPGFRAPAGLPMLVLLPAEADAIVSAQLVYNGGALELCRFDGDTYVHHDPEAEALGRSVLRSRNTTVLIPRAPLRPGSYLAAIATRQLSLSWSFTVE